MVGWRAGQDNWLVSQQPGIFCIFLDQRPSITESLPQRGSQLEIPFALSKLLILSDNREHLALASCYLDVLEVGMQQEGSPGTGLGFFSTSWCRLRLGGVLPAIVSVTGLSKVTVSSRGGGPG